MAEKLRINTQQNGDGNPLGTLRTGTERDSPQDIGVEAFGNHRL